MALQTQVVLDHFENNVGYGPGHYMQSVTYQVVYCILSEKKFDSLAAVLAFCENADNLAPWLPSENDRILCSIEISEGLRSLNASHDFAGASGQGQRRCAG